MFSCGRSPDANLLLLAILTAENLCSPLGGLGQKK